MCNCSDPRGTKLRVDNLHYELTQQDLEVRPSAFRPS